MSPDLDELRESAPDLETLLDAALDDAFGGKTSDDQWSDWDARR